MRRYAGDGGAGVIKAYPVRIGAPGLQVFRRKAAPPEGASSKCSKNSPSLCLLRLRLTLRSTTNKRQEILDYA